MNKLEQSLFEIGLNAAIKHPKASLWARVNSAADFGLVISKTIESAILMIFYFWKPIPKWSG